MFQATSLISYSSNVSSCLLDPPDKGEMSFNITFQITNIEPKSTKGSGQSTEGPGLSTKVPGPSTKVPSAEDPEQSYRVPGSTKPPGPSREGAGWCQVNLSCLLATHGMAISRPRILVQE
jgi:hypothetical protein